MAENVKTTFAIHAAALDLIVTTDLYLKLYTNDYTPTSAMTSASFTEATGGGYAHKKLEGTEANATPVAIEGLSQAAACVVTWTGHDLASGDKVTIADITQADWTALNAEHTITRIDANSFSIPVNTSGYAAAYAPETDPGTITETTASDWTAEANDPRDVIAPEQTFTFTGALTGDATIYGWYLITKDLATVKAAKRLDTPYQPGSGGGTLKFTPRIQASNI